MALTFGMERPKAEVLNTLNVTLAVGTPVETDTSGQKSVFFPINITGQNPPSFDVADCTITNTSTTVTTSNSFSKVRVGDTVTGTGIPASTTVASIESETSLTLDQAATASGTETLTFDPEAIPAATLYGLNVKYEVKNSNLGLLFSLMTYDGSLGSTLGDDSNATHVDALKTSHEPISINLDTFLSTLRVDRVS